MDVSPIDADAFNAFEAAGWADRADAYHRAFGGLTSRVVEPLLDAAGVRSGTRVLDVASGPGYAAAACAARGAEVVGVDASPGMVALARRSHPSIEFREADAEALPFGDGSFEAVAGNFVVLHLGRPEAAAAGFARVLAPGGGVALSVWDVPERARLLGVMVDAVARAGAQPSGDVPPGPPFFRFSDDDEFARLLADVGLRDVEVRTIAFTHRFTSSDELWDGLVEGTVRTRALVLGQPDEVRTRIRTEFDALLGEYEGDRGFEVPVSVKLASGRRR